MASSCSTAFVAVAPATGEMKSQGLLDCRGRVTRAGRGGRAQLVDRFASTPSGIESAVQPWKEK
ncbi:hypothetical protein ACFV7Q_20285 [Streptomyces sp. NPDC059851]|uniref:hypothetical protein n=1 Tax=Streptomyces sp. NPDC059851 TaxID=3346971 RepID=UPI00364990FA